MDQSGSRTENDITIRKVAKEHNLVILDNIYANSIDSICHEEKAGHLIMAIEKNKTLIDSKT